VAVTGAAGFIGWHACERLRDAGWTVVGVTRANRDRPLPPGVERASSELDAQSMARACGGASAIVHAAGITYSPTPDAYRLVNVEGAREVAEAARLLGARLIHIGSLAGAGPAAADCPRSETTPCSPLTPYARSKIESEAEVARVGGLRWTVLRPAAVYGPRDRQLLPLFKAARRGLMPRPPNAATYSLTFAYVDDVARAIEMTCANEMLDGETLFVGHPDAVSIDELTRVVAKTLKRSRRVLPVPWAAIRVAAQLGIGGLNEERFVEMRAAGFVCSVERAEQRLGFRAAFDLPRGLQATAAWYIANGWI
jgi:nucleoside-diphosphate-sugar epimerase